MMKKVIKLSPFPTCPPHSLGVNHDGVGVPIRQRRNDLAVHQPGAAQHPGHKVIPKQDVEVQLLVGEERVLCGV